MSEELIINDQNFNEYFYDVRTHQPQHGQVMACYTAIADFIDGPLKRDVLNILEYHDALSVPKIMKKVGCAAERDSYRIPIEMVKDLLSGMPREQVAQKQYRYTVEVFFYTKKECVPKYDPHWSVISIMNLDEFLDANNNRISVKTREVTNVQDSPA